MKKITKKKSLLTTGAALGVLAAAAVTVTPAIAHGTSDDPKGRSLGCLEAGVAQWPFGETEFAGCNDGYDIAGAGQFENWNQIVIGDTRQGNYEPQYRSLIPDGQLCSAGDPNMAGLDVPTDQWPTTELPAGEEFTLNYLATAVHNPYTFSYYVTKDGYDPSKPLTWDDLESTPFLVADSLKPATEDGRGGTFELPTVLPDKTGHHVVYTIWQGNIKEDGSVQSNEAFFACSDVEFN